MLCQECADFEFRRDHPVRWRVGKLLEQRASPAMMFMREASMMYAILGGRSEPTHYERHRDEYARTGDQLELERMLRQVSDGE